MINIGLEELANKIEVLETRQAFHEDTVESLNKVIIQQQQDIDRLQLLIEILEERIKQSANQQTDIASEEQPPPHY